MTEAAWDDFLTEEDGQDWTGPRTLAEAVGLLKTPEAARVYLQAHPDVPPILRDELAFWVEMEAKSLRALEVKGDFLGHPFRGNQWQSEDAEYHALTNEQKDAYDRAILEKDGYTHATALHVAKLSPATRGHYAPRWQANTPNQERLLAALARRPSTGPRKLGDGEHSHDTIQTLLPLAPKGKAEELTKELRARLDAGDVVAARTEVPVSAVQATEKYMARNSVATIVKVLDEGKDSPNYRPGYLPYVVKQGDDYFVFDGHHRFEAAAHSGIAKVESILVDLNQHHAPT